MNRYPGPEELRVQSVQFLREQDGAPERLLKARVREAFVHEKAVQRAYLAQIRAGEHTGVALCIKATAGRERRLAQNVGAVFATIFGAHEHLDILFLTDPQEASLKNVCSPFFSASSDH